MVAALIFLAPVWGLMGGGGGGSTAFRCAPYLRNAEGHNIRFFQESIHKQVLGKVTEGFSTTFH